MAQVSRTVLLDIQDTSPDEYPVVGYGGVVVLKGRGPGEQDSSARDARHHRPTRRGGRYVLNLF